MSRFRNYAAAGLAVLGTAGLAAFHWIRASLPDYGADAVVAGLQQPVEIVRDRFGIPHIHAATERDAYLGLGYVHAQDRLWQMEMNRRSGKGELAEALGPPTAEQDRLMRTLGLRQAAARTLDILDGHARSLLEAYAQGVNQYAGNARSLPPEFAVHGIAPAPWVPADSLVWLKTMAWNLSGNWWDELLRLRLRNRLTPRQLAELVPPYPGDAAVALPDDATLYGALERPAAALMALLPGGPLRSTGSNSWAVDGSRTASGKPLLANDPHLRLSAPSLWYFAHLQAPGINVIGATLPGVPGVLLGRNDHVAWSFTNTGTDSQDLYLEQPVAGSPSRYRSARGEEEFAVRRETVKVKGAPDQTWLVRSSRHGPIISDAIPEAQDGLPLGGVLALRWVGLEYPDTTVQFLFKAAVARDGGELREAARDYRLPQQNVVYADDAGNLGFIATGQAPVRRPDNPLKGLLPAPGWDERYEWTGLIPFESLPQQAGTAQIVTANQKITPPDYPYWITGGWQLPHRAERIGALLAAEPVHTVESFTAIQMDVRNPLAARLLPYLLQVRPAEGQDGLLQRLRGWNGDMAADRPEPLLFAEWLRRLTDLLCQDRLGELYQEVGDYNPQFLENVLADADGQSHWCRDAGYVDCGEAVRRAWEAGVAALQRRYGRDPSRWSWGAAHPALSAHSTLTGVPLLSRWFDLAVASPGGFDTVNVSGYFYDAAKSAYIGAAGPSFRAVYDLAEPDRSVFVLSTGQSGHPFSPHYRDQLEAWLQGRPLPMVTGRERVLREAAHSMRLQPG